MKACSQGASEIVDRRLQHKNCGFVIVVSFFNKLFGLNGLINNRRLKLCFNCGDLLDKSFGSSDELFVVCCSVVVEGMDTHLDFE